MYGCNSICLALKRINNLDEKECMSSETCHKVYREVFGDNYIDKFNSNLFWEIHNASNISCGYEQGFPIIKENPYCYLSIDLQIGERLKKEFGNWIMITTVPEGPVSLFSEKDGKNYNIHQGIFDDIMKQYDIFKKID